MVAANSAILSAITNEEIKRLFSMKPEEAIRFFRSKGLKITWNWRDMAKEQHARAFTVAKVMREDILKDIKSAVEEALDKGTPYRDFEEKLKPILQSKGWWGKAVDASTGEITPSGKNGSPVQMGSPNRLSLIYETNMQVAYMAGRYQSMMAVTKYAPWWEYVAVMDRRTRPSHAELNGLVFRFDDQFWLSFYPPNGFRCRCRVVAREDFQRERGDFEVSYGEGRMETVTKTWKRRNGTIAFEDVHGYRHPGTGKIITPDIGWDYHPGKEAFH